MVSHRAAGGVFSGGSISGEVDIFSNRHKQQFGAGTEFADHRVYVQGDDLRRLDWNLFARFGEGFIKRFDADVDVNIYFLLDCSASMQAGLGKFNKYDYAQRIIASLSYIALSELNRVGVVSFSGGVIDMFPLTRGKSKFFNLLKFLERHKPADSKTDIRLSVDNFIRKTKRAGIAVIVSDFFDYGGCQVAIERLRYNKFEPVIIQLHADFEADPKLQPEFQSVLKTNFNLVSAENENIKNIKNNEINITINDSTLNQYKICFDNFLDEIKRYCINKCVSHIITKTSTPLEEIILKIIRNKNILK
ncbi:MAG: DUF58 domain-containing protein [Planctomycetaceae bacterium]|nr:DUF58 domain-containing protein [Planctomycetaceae bacterium]